MLKIIKKFINKISRLSLRRKTVLFISFGTILPFIIMMLFLLSSLSKTAVNVEKKALDETVLLVKQDLLSSIQAKAQIFDLTFKSMIIDLESLKESILSEGFKEKLLTAYYYKHQIISAVYFINTANSIFIAPTNEKFSQGENIDISNIKELNFLTSESGSKYTGRWLGPYDDFKGQARITTYAVPLWKGNEYKGMLGLDLAINSLFSEIVRIDPSQSSYFFIVKSNGDFVSSSEKIYDDFKLEKKESPNIFDSQLIKEMEISDIFTPQGEKEGTFMIQEDEENQKIAAFSIIPSFGGKIATVSPLTEIIQIQKEKAKEIQQAVNRVGTIGFAYMIGLSLFIIVISFYLSGQITGPIINLRNAAREISQGKLDTKIEIKSEDEIGELATDFNTMVIRLLASRRELEKYAEELEDRVVERTLELKEERDRVNAIIASMGDGLIVVDKKYKITLLNPSAERSLETTQDKMKGKSIDKIIPLFTGKEGKEEVALRDHPITKARESGEIIITRLEDNFYLQKAAGKRFAVIMVVAPLFGEGVSGAVMMFRDVSEEKQLDEAKTSFISVSSHQLRTPLTSMRWFSEMLMGGDAGPITKEQKHFLERIYEGTDRMIGLVNLLLQIARVEAGRVKIEPVPIDLKATTQGVLVALKSNIDQKSQKVVIESNPDQFPLIPMDQEVVWQVIQNLLSNANRYSPEKSTIHVSIMKKDNVIEYSVKDEGIGISKDQQGRIFEKFY